MFALEIDFNDGVSTPEVLFIRRPFARIGSSDLADVVIDYGAKVMPDIILCRGAQREFSCYLAEEPEFLLAKPSFLEGSYSGDAEIKWGDLNLHIVTLDLDLALAATLNPEISGAMLLNEVFEGKVTRFPAVAVIGERPVVVSFRPGQEILVGKSRKCAVRLDASDVSFEHALIKFENDKFYVSDLGSSAGTKIEGVPVKEETSWQIDQNLRIGTKVHLLPLQSDRDLAKIGIAGVQSCVFEKSERKFPYIVAMTPDVRPRNLVIPEDRVITIGRDPTNDIWLGAAHISRKHAELELLSNGVLKIKDTSSNGTFFYGDRLPYGEYFDLPNDNLELDFSEDVVLKVLFFDDPIKETIPNPLSSTGVKSVDLFELPEKPASFEKTHVKSLSAISDELAGQIISQTDADEQNLLEKLDEASLDLSESTGYADNTFGEVDNAQEEQQRSSPVFLLVVVILSVIAVPVAVALALWLWFLK